MRMALDREEVEQSRAGEGRYNFTFTCTNQIINILIFQVSLIETCEGQ